MNELTYGSYQEYKEALDRELNRTAEGFVKIGYLLKIARDTDILKESGYHSLTEFAQAEYNLDPSQVSRFIAINDRFAVEGYSDRLTEQYQGFGIAKLSMMLTMPVAIVEQLSPAYSKTEINQIKSEIEEEKKISDLEIMTEEKEAPERTELETVVYQIGRENPEIYLELYDAAGDVKMIQEVLAPAGEGIISVRIPGTGRVMLSVKDISQPVILIHVRSGEKAEYAWNDLVTAMKGVWREAENSRKSWEDTYGEPYPEEKTEDIAPVQKEESKKKKPEKKSKVTKAKPEPPKAKPKEEPKQQKTPGTPVKQEEPKQTKESEYQTSIEDFPEFLPDGYIKCHDGTEVEEKEGKLWEEAQEQLKILLDEMKESPDRRDPEYMAGAAEVLRMTLEEIKAGREERHEPINRE